MACCTRCTNVKWSGVSGQWSLATTHGFTLAETLIASVVLAVSVVAVSGAIIASQQQTTVSQEDMIAIALARQLAEQAAARPLTSTDATAGWPTVTDYTQYDTINDFAGYTDKASASIFNNSALTATGTFSSARPTVTTVTSGTPTLARGEYSRVVSVTYPTSIFGKSVAGGDFTAGDFAIVTVTVRGFNGSSVALSRLQPKLTVTR